MIALLARARCKHSSNKVQDVSQPWPELEPVKVPPQGEVRWHRNVVRFPPEVAVQLEESPAGSGGGGSRTLVLSGKAGTIRLNMQWLSPPTVIATTEIDYSGAGKGAGGWLVAGLGLGRWLAGGGGGSHHGNMGDSSGAAAKQPSQPPSKPPAAAAAAGGGATGVAGTGRSVLVLVGPNKSRFDEAVESINSAIRGVMSGYLVGLTVKGVGYRMEPVEDDRGEVASRVPQLSYAQLLRRSRAPGGPRPKPYYFEAAGEEKNVINFPYSKPASAIRLKVGYSRTVVYPLPPHIRAFCLKPTLVYLYGLEMDELQRVAAEIRSIRKPNPYTGNGVQYVDEVVKLKQRARAK
ncbi:hypothetical protein VOLCADRAFT_99166 [Volvox carteri f. nagariensis]|uniref:Large ribosomal subunit protein uL6 alpha-beta domain-containing protein n=1 Tax=Volvox carteri f. nagariensis TaxID=3068 RepID=D8UH56_VOLCA|nr:uncharacterized protein VOLCADRAFT_99166 [Volvox carteri f. nagariensis]EFJ40918.1 hypothetical protein VOLCADRAFT_99166 [Volvox carteri f. nagariensis]|eukprot:XP_002957985.1 hypothetical protein VOLCADRAFT_99166 [Volvox carteri f. nagariensis]